jgi:DHA1 family multidrug resistance protein-like MFS transporter
MSTKIFNKLLGPDLPGIYYGLLFIGFNIMIGMSLASSFLPILADSLDQSGVLVGLVVSSWFISRIFIELPAGIISDRIGRSNVLFMGLGLSLIGPILCSQAVNIYVLIVGRAIWGMGTALYFMSNTALLMDILPVTTRGKALGVFQGVEFIGSFIGAPLGAWISLYLSFTDVFYVSTLFIVISIGIAIGLKDVRIAGGEGKHREGLSLELISSSFKKWSILAVCFNNFFRRFLGSGLTQTVLVLYLNKNRGLSVADIGWIVGARIAGMVVFLFIAGILSDRFGRKPILILGYIMNGASFFLFTAFENYAVLLFTSSLGGAGDGLIMTTLMALLTDISPLNTRGMVVGFFRTFQDIGGFLGPLVLMTIYANTSPVVPFYLAAGISLSNIISISTIKVPMIARTSS